MYAMKDYRSSGGHKKLSPAIIDTFITKINKFMHCKMETHQHNALGKILVK
jgi:hypothetical protein